MLGLNFFVDMEPGPPLLLNFCIEVGR